MPNGLRDEGADAERTDAVLDNPMFRGVDPTAWEWPPSVSQFAGDAVRTHRSLPGWPTDQRSAASHSASLARPKRQSYNAKGYQRSIGTRCGSAAAAPC
jgi:hypothetical protein